MLIIVINKHPEHTLRKLCMLSKKTIKYHINTQYTQHRPLSHFYFSLFPSNEISCSIILNCTIGIVDEPYSIRHFHINGEQYNKNTVMSDRPQ